MTGSDFERNHDKQIFSDLPAGSGMLTGTADNTVRWIEKAQLLNASLWTKFVNEFRIRTDDGDNAWRGEYWGKMLRGAVTVYRYTQDARLYKVLSDTVRDMMSTQEENGRISTYSQEHDFSNWDIWCRKYVMLGMEFFLEICREPNFREEITECLCRQCDYLYVRIGEASENKLPITETTRIYGGMNSSSVLEPVVILYWLTKKGRYLRLAEHIVSCGGSKAANIFRLALEDKTDPYAYGVSKAYEMISCFEGLLEYYYATGIEWCRQSVENFARKVAASDVTVIGSCGCTHEIFDHSSVRQSKPSEAEEIMQETCVTVTWMKFCHKLFKLTGDPVFADCIEKSYYNAYLGALNTERHTAKAAPKSTSEREIIDTFLAFDSYSPLTEGTRGRKIGGLQVLADGSYFGCCACIGAIGAGIFANAQIMTDKDGLLLCFYESGMIKTTSPSGSPLKLNIDSKYPFGNGKINITILSEKKETFKLSLRIPQGVKTTIKICENEIPVKNGITDIVREWKNGDVISIDFDMSIRLIPSPVYDTTVIYNIDWSTGGTLPVEEHQQDNAKKRICLTSGPIVLAAEKGLTRENIRLPLSPVFEQNGNIKCHPVSVPGYRKTISVSDHIAGDLVFCDYASAGQSWNDETELSVWIPVNEEYIQKLPEN